MNVHKLASTLQVPVSPNEDAITIYEKIRGYYFERCFNCLRGVYQSPSYPNTPLPQSTPLQTGRPGEAYLRYDFDPSEAESAFNLGHRALDHLAPKTFFFSSGMSSITTLLLYLARIAGSRRLCVGQRVYFEAVRLMRQLFRVVAEDEYDFKVPSGTQILWLDYPLSTEPNQLPNLNSILDRFVSFTRKYYDQDFYIVIDYTVAAFAFDIRQYITGLAENIHIVLITSLQKHMGYGLDLAKGGAITIYSRSPELASSLARLRTYSGSCLPETAYYLMPPIIPSVIRQLVRDAGANASRLATAITQLVTDAVHLHYPSESSSKFTTSLLFLEIANMSSHQIPTQPFPSDHLLQAILHEASRSASPIAHGESFGFPMTRIHKWGTAQSDVRSIRISVGYDEGLASAAIEPILAGITRFASEYANN